MNDKRKGDAKKTLSLAKKTDVLKAKKTISSGQVRQQFSHGRSKTVQVEVKRRRSFMSTAEGENASSSILQDEAKPAIPEGLTEQEWLSRLRAVQVEKQRISQDSPEEDKKTFTQQIGVKKVEGMEPLPQVAPKKESPAKADEKESVKEGEEPEVGSKKELTDAEGVSDPSSKKVPSETKEEKSLGKHVSSSKKQEEDEEEQERRKRLKERNDDQRRGRLTLQQALTAAIEEENPDEDVGVVLPEEGEKETLRHKHTPSPLRKSREKRARTTFKQPPQRVVREVIVPESIQIKELAHRMAVRSTDLIGSLMKMGTMATLNDIIEGDVAQLLVEEFGHHAIRVSEEDIEIQFLQDPEDAPESLKPRAPVVTVMGHVDHGKTSLLDALRETDVASGEKGGITQHIGAYQVQLHSGAKITFIDTPGHAAFTEMRARGAQVTDIVVLVVAADDGIKEQTVEAINHVKAAGVPMIVAINKIDKPEANVDRVRQELLSHEIVPEELGGDVLTVAVSAKQKKNLDKLEEAILLQAEILELKANPDRSAQGVVIEAKLEQGRGPVSTVLVQKGTLKIGDVFIAGTEWGRVRILMDGHGKRLKQVGPSVPIEVVGFDGTPVAGDKFSVVEDESQARRIVDYRQQKTKEQNILQRKQSSALKDMFAQVSAQKKELAVVIKADVQGSLEAIANSFDKISTEEASVRLLHSGVGGITESDVILARASQAVIIGFNVRANSQARDLAARDSINIRYYSIIYNVLDDIKAALSGLLEPTLREKPLGQAAVRQVFSVTKIGKVAGCMVTEGLVKRGARVRLLRDNIVIHEGELKSLRRFKDEVKEVKEGFECGMAFENFQDLKEGDTIECFEIEEIARTL